MNEKIIIKGISEQNDFFRKSFEKAIKYVGIDKISKILRPNEPAPESATYCITVGDAATRDTTKDQNLNVEDCHSYIMLCGGMFVIPCLDYRAVFKDGLNTHWLEWTLRKAKSLAMGTSTVDSPPHIVMRPSLTDVVSYCQGLLDHSEPIAIDIECVPDTSEITCIAFAANEDNVICIPLANKHLTNYWSPEEEVIVWQCIQDVLLSSNLKLFQNFIFDTMILRKFGIELNTNVEDTMVLASELNPLLPKGLRDLGRIYLNCPPWKDNKDYKLTGDIEAFWRYNALDASRTYQIYSRQQKELDTTGKRGHYETFVKPLYPLVYDTCSRGIAIDNVYLDKIRSELATILGPIEKELKLIGNPLVAPKQIKKKLRDKANDTETEKAFKEVIEEIPQEFNPNSDKQIKSVLIGLGYKIPITKGKESVNRENLLKLNRKSPSPFIGNLLPYNRLSKIKSTYASLVLDSDSRLRYFYNIAGTISGRFSASKTSWGTGLNILTIPRGISEFPLKVKNLFVPDAGKTLVEVDLSQAELRVVAWLANETKLIDLMENNEDVHQYTANRVSEISGLICPRQLGKRINHASNYGMGAEKFSDSCLLEADLSISVADARKLLQARSDTFPAISVWHRAIEAEIGRTRRLTSPLGRSAFFYGPLNDAMIRQGLSFIPQATVVDTINKAWIEMSKFPGYNNDFRCIAQVHDALVFEVDTKCLDFFMFLLNNALEQPIVINNIKRTIPWDIQVGDRWGELQKIA